MPVIRLPLFFSSAARKPSPQPISRMSRFEPAILSAYVWLDPLLALSWVVDEIFLEFRDIRADRQVCL